MLNCNSATLGLSQGAKKELGKTGFADLWMNQEEMLLPY